MKTLKWKWLTAAGMVSAFFVLVSAGTSEITSYSNNGEEMSPGSNTAPASSPNGRFEKENSDIQRDISNINMHRERIDALKEEYKADKKADRDMEVIVDKKDLKKAHADLKRDRMYLKADKKDLKCDHKLALKERRQEIRRDREALRESRRALNRELNNGNEATAREYASRVVQMQRELNRDEAALEQDREDMKENMMAVNEAIRNSNGGWFSSGSGAVVAKNSTTSSNSR
jgi:hypothetical protein